MGNLSGRMPTKGIFPTVQTVRDPLPTEDTNPVVVLSMNAAGDVVKVRKTIGTAVYEKTISNADSVITSTKTISAWSKI